MLRSFCVTIRALTPEVKRLPLKMQGELREAVRGFENPVQPLRFRFAQPPNARRKPIVLRRLRLAHLGGSKPAWFPSSATGGGNPAGLAMTQIGGHCEPVTDVTGVAIRSIFVALRRPDCFAIGGRLIAAPTPTNENSSCGGVWAPRPTNTNENAPAV